MLKLEFTSAIGKGALQFVLWFVELINVSTSRASWLITCHAEKYLIILLVHFTLTKMPELCRIIYHGIKLTNENLLIESFLKKKYLQRISICLFKNS